MSNLNLSGVFNHTLDGGRTVVAGGYAELHGKLSGCNQFNADLVKHFKAQAKS